jgi:hypothetical protein
MRGRIRNQKGAGGLGCLMLVAIAAFGIYAGLQFGIPELRNTSFKDRLNETFTFFSRQSEKSIRNRIISIATDFDIELKPEQVKVLIEGDRLTIDIQYEKVADLKVWQKTLPFTIHRQGPY